MHLARELYDGEFWKAPEHDDHFALRGYLPRSRTWVEAIGSGRLFAYRRIVMNTLFGSSVYSPNGPQYVNPKLS